MPPDFDPASGRQSGCNGKIGALHGADYERLILPADDGRRLAEAFFGGGVVSARGNLPSRMMPQAFNDDRCLLRNGVATSSTASK